MDAFWYERIFFSELALPERQKLLLVRREELFEQHQRLEQQQRKIEDQRARLEWLQQVFKKQDTKLEQQLENEH
jgi:hypothetical protein